MVGAMMTAFDQSVYASMSNSRDTADLRAQFERLRPWYSRFLADVLPRDTSARILDVPCGAGNLLFTLQSLGYTQAVGYDGDPGQIGLAQALGLSAKQGDALEALAQTPPGSIAVVFSLDFLEHLPKETAVRFCASARRALAPGGLLVCRTPSADGPFGSRDRYNDLTHKWSMTANVAEALMRLAGFRGVEVRQEAPPPYHWKNRLRRLLFLGTTRLLSAYLTLCGIAPPRVWTTSMWIIARK